MRLGRLFRIASLASALLGVSTAHAGINQWTTTGPEGGLVTSVTLLPSQPGVALATGGDSIYRTTDSGVTWMKVVTGLPGTPRHFAIDPTHSNRVLVTEPNGVTSTAPGSILRSDDGGATFTTIPFDSTMPIGVLAFNADGTVLYGASGSMGRMYASTDLGAHWTEISNGLPGAASYEPAAVAADPTDSDTVYLSIPNDGVYRSSDRGQTWVTAGLAGNMVRRIAVDPTSPNRLLAAANSGLWMSTDRGASWALVNAPLSSYAWVGFDRADPTRVLACGGDAFFATTTQIASGNWQTTTGSFVGWPQDASFDSGRVLVGSSTGAQFSSDAGNTVLTRNHGIYSASASQLVAAADGTLYSAFYSGLAGVYKRETTGWNAVNNYDLFLLQGQQPGVGLVPNLSSLAVARTDSQTMYAVGYRGVMRTSDGGAHWSKASTQFDSEIMTQVMADPQDRQIAYVTTLAVGLWRTADGGSSWEQRSTGLPASMRAIAIDPVNTNVVYAAGAGPSDTLFKSTDAGLHWAATGLTQQSIQSLAIDPVHPEIVYAVCIDDIYRSADAGVSWKSLHTEGSLYELLIDPQVPSVLTAIGHTQTASGLRSVDSGATWEALSPLAYFIPTETRHGVADPLRPQHFFAATAMNGLLEFEVAPDLRMSVESLPTRLTRSTSTSAVLSVSNAGPFAASDVKVTATLPAWLTVSTAPAGCSVSGSNVLCALGAIKNGERVDWTIPLAIANTDGTGTFVATVNGHETDPDASNNSVSVSVETAAAAAAPTPPASNISGGGGSGGGGGGGRFEWISAMALLLCLVYASKRSPASRSRSYRFMS